MSNTANWPAEVEALTKMRLDRRYGTGTYDDMVRRAAEKPSSIYAKLLHQDRSKAGLDLRDAAEVLGPLVLSESASEWAKLTFALPDSVGR